MHTKWRWRMACLGAGLACACGAGCNAILGLGDPKVTVKDGGNEAATPVDGMVEGGDGARLLEGGNPDDTGSLDATLDSDASGGDTGVRDTTAGDVGDGDTGGGDTSAGDASVGDTSAVDGSLGDTGGGDADAGAAPDGPVGDSCASDTCAPILLNGPDGVNAPHFIAQDSLYVYWTDWDHTQVGRTNKNTGAIDVLWFSLDSPNGIAVDDAGNMFWGDNAPGVWRCPTTGCVPTRTLVSSSGYTVSWVAVDDRNVYWTEQGTGVWAVRSARKDGVDAGYQTLWQSDAGVTPNSIATDGQRVYFTADDGKVYFTNVGGGAATSLGMANDAGARGVALDNSAVYWTVFDPAAGSVNVASKSTLAVGTIAPGQTFPIDVATDGINVYWVNYGSGTVADGTVFKCAIPCQTPIALASNQAGPRAILVDNAYVYWTDNGQTLPNGVGTLWKVAK